MTRIMYTNEDYERITQDEMDEGMNAQFEPIVPDPRLQGVRLAIPLGPCLEEPEIVVPLDFLKASGAMVDIIAPDWTPHNWLPATRFWTPTLKIPYQKKISEATAAHYQGVILVGGTWNPAVVRTDKKMLEFIRQVARKECPVFSICYGAQILISVGLVSKGLKVTGSLDIRIDLRNAAAEVIEDQAVVVDKGIVYIPNWPSAGSGTATFTLVSSRDHSDLPLFCRIHMKISFAINRKCPPEVH